MTTLPKPVCCSVRCAALALALLSAPWAMAADAGGQSPVNGLERRLEIPAHRLLQEVRARSADPSPFATDGCSGGLSYVWAYVAESFPAFARVHEARPPWEACCVEHDRAYHLAGPDPDPERSFDNRLEADKRLRACVLATVDERSSSLAAGYGMTPAQVRAAYSAIAEAMYLAVRVGGGPCTGMPWRWGYGYPPCSLASK